MTVLMWMIMVCVLSIWKQSTFIESFSSVFLYCVCVRVFFRVSPPATLLKSFRIANFITSKPWMYWRILWFQIRYTIFQLKIMMINIISFLLFIWHMGKSHRMMSLTKSHKNQEKYNKKFNKMWENTRHSHSKWDGKIYCIVSKILITNYDL